MSLLVVDARCMSVRWRDNRPLMGSPYVREFVDLTAEEMDDYSIVIATGGMNIAD